MEKKTYIALKEQSNEPIYQQIVKSIKTAILNQELKQGDELPSMRNLAKELRISLITTKRAYEELEREGYIFSQVGKGSYVSGKSIDFIDEEIKSQIEELFCQAIELSKQGNLSNEDLVEMLKTLMEV